VEIHQYRWPVVWLKFTKNQIESDYSITLKADASSVNNLF
jgi:hypothetical protein